MTKISFYRQQRVDGGVRAGINLNEVTVLELFNPGKTESNPALLWFVDIRIEGRSLPNEPEQVREWLLENTGLFRQALASAADELQIGLDADVWPYVQELRGTPSGVRGSLVVSGVRGLAEGELAKKLRETAKQLGPTLKKMEPLLPV